jgi:rare lipoprotein A
MARSTLTELACLGVASGLAGLLVAPAAHARDAVLKTKSPRRIVRASWYGNSFNGKRTASGSIFNSKVLTAAHRSMDFGSKVKVTEMRSGRSVVVEITDRGPYLPGRDIDLSYAAAQALGIVQAGVARVSVEVLDRKHAPPSAPIVTAFSWPATPWLPRAVLE